MRIEKQNTTVTDESRVVHRVESVRKGPHDRKQWYGPKISWMPLLQIDLHPGHQMLIQRIAWRIVGDPLDLWLQKRSFYCWNRTALEVETVTMVYKVRSQHVFTTFWMLLHQNYLYNSLECKCLWDFQWAKKTLLH